MFLLQSIDVIYESYIFVTKFPDYVPQISIIDANSGSQLLTKIKVVIVRPMRVRLINTCRPMLCSVPTVQATINVVPGEEEREISVISSQHVTHCQF